MIKNSMDETREADPTLSQKVFVYAESGEYINDAQSLSEKLRLCLVQDIPPTDSGKLVLKVGENGVTLSQNILSLRGDFSAMLPRMKVNNLNGEMIVKAARIKDIKSSELTVFDATAGLGEDSFLLAAVGFNVELYEFDPVIAALLRDALGRAEKDPLLSEIVKRMTLYEDDSIAALSHLKTVPDIILLDPMFPARHKSGAIKKKFQLLQQLESPCVNEKELLQAALEAHPRKIVIKRPKNSGYLADHIPSYSIMGTSIRYDCILNCDR